MLDVLTIRQQRGKHPAIIETSWARTEGKQSPRLTPSAALCFPCKIICAGKESSSTLLIRAPILHGLIWSMVSTSPRPRRDLRSHQAHTFERHLFIFRMQMQPTSKAISCREHTMWMCWSALPGGWGPTYVRFSTHQPPTPLHVNPGGHTQTPQQRGFSHTKTRVYPFCCVIYKSFNGGHLHKVCRRLRCSLCQMRVALRGARSNNAKISSPCPPLLCPFWHPPLSSSERLQWRGVGTQEG